MIYLLFNCIPADIVTLCGAALCFILTFLFTLLFKDRLPCDIGRAFAVNAAAAKGKPRGAGIIFVLVFAVISMLFLPFSLENTFYCLLLIAAMFSGYLDDGSKIPWSDYKKGLIDLVISFLITLNFALNNSTELTFAIAGKTLTLPLWLYLILGTVLVWVSINVVNCTDGVDGLSSCLTLVSLASFIVAFNRLSESADGDFKAEIILFMSAVCAYLFFNASPSILLMGDAGSRTIGVFFALTAMKSGSPLLFIPLCIVFIIDGGLGLVKVALLRFLKIKIFKNTRTPIHDHVRKNKGWSDTHAVIRFTLIQVIISFIWLTLIR